MPRPMYAYLILSLLALGGCSSMKTLDRGRLNSKIMLPEEYTALDQVSPHTGMRASGNSNGGGCSVCAH